MVGALYKAAADVVKRSDFVEPLAAQGLEARQMNPAQFAAFIKGELVLYGKIVKAANIKPE